jgi:hypothetical protein
VPKRNPGTPSRFARRKPRRNRQRRPGLHSAAAGGHSPSKTGVNFPARPKRHRQAQLIGNAVQSLIMRPPRRSGGQSNRSEQMDIDVSDPAPKQRVPVDEVQDFRVRDDARLGQARHGAQNELALTQIADGQLTDDEGVRQYHSGIKSVEWSLTDLAS